MDKEAGKTVSVNEMATASDGKAPEQKMQRMRRFHRGMRMNRKSYVMVIAGIVLLGALYAGRGLFVAAIVDGSPISRWSIVRELEKKSGEQALDALVTKKIIHAAAMKSGIMVSQSDIDAEVASITDQVTKQGGTLAMALEQQGMTEMEFRDQIVLQKELEKMLAGKVTVSDDDVNQYITQNKVTAPKGMTDEDLRNSIREQLKGQKFNTEATKWVANAKAEAQIQYFVDYAPKPLPVSELPAGEASSKTDK